MSDEQKREDRQRWLAAFGQIVRELRAELGLSQVELGEQCGLDRTYLSGIERGRRNPTLWTVWQIAEGLETTPSELIRRTDQGLADTGVC